MFRAKPSRNLDEPDWKARYGAQKARLAALEERLRWHDRMRLRPEVVGELLPERAAWRRRTPPDMLARARDAALTAYSTAYAVAKAGPPPAGADEVEIAGLSWWVPRDDRRKGTLGDRVVASKWLPLVDILRTREAIGNGIMLDIGANIGLTSITRVIAGDTAVVYAAEPAPDNYACLVRNVCDNGLIGLVLPDLVAISDEDGHARLRLSASIGGHLLSERGSVEVATRRLDTWMTGLGVPPDGVCYVKVDTQGRESHVLSGAPALLGRRGIMWELEFSPRHLRRARRDAADLIAQMQAAFTHFIDLAPDAPGARVRPVDELGEAMAYLGDSFTNVLAYRARAS